MYIRRLVIRNLRAISVLDVSLGPQLTSLVGANNTGKTTVLHALRLVLDANLPLSARRLQREDFSAGLDLAAPQQILVAVEFADFSSLESEALVSDWTTADGVAAICYRFRPNRKTREALTSGVRLSGSLKIEDYDWQINGLIGKDPVTLDWKTELGAKVDIERLSAFHITFLKALRDVEDELRKTRSSPLTRLLEAAELSEAQKEALLVQLRAANTAVRNSPTVQGVGDAINQSMQNTVGEAYGIGVGIGVADASFSSLARSLVVLLTGRGLVDGDPSRNGLGLNNALYVSMLLEVFRRTIAKSNIAGQLLLVEEPEAHLHPELQRIIFAVLQSSGCQVIATTHSTHVTSMSPVDNLVVLSEVPAGVDVVVPSRRLSSSEKSDLERYLDATRSTLLFAKKVILVEGMSEVFLIPPLVKKILNVDLLRLGVSLVPIHGAHFVSYAKLFGPEAVKKRCAIITDGDFAPGEDPESEESEGNPTLPELRLMANDYLHVFSCDTTFEREIATRGNLKMFSSAAANLGANKTRQKLERLYADASAAAATEAAEIVLRLAKAKGKARFAQVSSKFVDLALDLPKYICDAVQWVVG